MMLEKTKDYFVTRYSLIPDIQLDLDSFCGITKEKKFLDWLMSFNIRKKQGT
jgi:hypothetical protein